MFLYVFDPFFFLYLFVAFDPILGGSCANKELNYYIMQKINTCKFISMACYGNLNQSQVLIDIQQLCKLREIVMFQPFSLFHFSNSLFYNINIVMLFPIIAWSEHFDDTKVVIRDRKSKRDRWHNGKKEKVQTMIYKTLCGKPHYRKRRYIQVLRKGRQFLLHMWHPSCYSCNKPDCKSLMWKWPDSHYDKQHV